MQSPTLENQVIKKDKNLRSLSSEGMHDSLTLASNFISLREERFWVWFFFSSGQYFPIPTFQTTWVLTVHLPGLTFYDNMKNHLGS